MEIGRLKIRPFGFFDEIGVVRSDELPHSVSTRFGAVPLSNTPKQILASPGHSRIQAMSEMPVGAAKVSVWLEADFQNPQLGQNPYRWRQYWASVEIGKWEILGGKAWSLLRGNRLGITSESGMMNTDVVEPAYHVGLVGARDRQLRVVRRLAHGFAAGVEASSGGIRSGKLVQDSSKWHWEVQGMSGTRGRSGVGFEMLYALSKKVRLVSQQYWSRKAIADALGLAPAGASGHSLMEGVELQVAKGWEVYGYGGGVWASRTATGNRRVDEWSVGVNRTLPGPVARTRMMMSVQYSLLGRETWAGASGRLGYVMGQVRVWVN